MTTIKPNKTPIVFNTFFAIFMTFYSFILSLFIRYLVIVFIITYKKRPWDINTSDLSDIFCLQGAFHHS